MDVARLAVGPPPRELASDGPGWEYSLDRLVTVVDGGDVRSARFADSFPVMRGSAAELTGS